ncbi:hypothetical protein [Nocardioides sp. SR21]|uniref:hypothetical protein n=1 Tax=Nocardioides sp. SR21 TaxID=2919501 RepID=UPI001FAA3DBD|nr:hypothetical protein [Nocardioides sp. SR21]
MNDDELLHRLQASDPAASLPPADPERVARLLEDVMSTELTTENRETGTHDRSPLTWLVAAAAAVIIAGVGIFAFLQLNDDSTTPVAVDPVQVSDPTVTVLSAPQEAAYAAKCMVPSAEVLAGQTVAFDGTVTGIDGSTVTLTPTTWYAGDPTDTVEVQAPSADMQLLLSAVSFEDGGRYLVSATDGRVTLCGFSAAYSDELATIYARAFAG